MTLTPAALQMAGIGVLAVIGLLFLWWVVRAGLGWHRGRPIYMLPDAGEDDLDDGDDGGGQDGQ